MKIGLTIGKFAPLHKGHQWMIETALKEVDQLIIIVYDAPDAENMPMDMRIKWLLHLYPKVKIIRADHPPRDKGYTETIQKSMKIIYCPFWETLKSMLFTRVKFMENG